MCYNVVMVDLKTITPNNLWYVIGLIVTDGNLSKDGRHMSITSKDRQYLFYIRRALGLTVKIGRKSRGGSRKKNYSSLQFGDVKFYKYLLEIGLTPNKSLTLGVLKIDEVYFHDFLRGVIDGDGSINSWIHKTNRHEQWALRIISGSFKFIGWLQKMSFQYFNAIGRVHVYPKRAHHNELYVLKFGKIAAKIIIDNCYYGNCLSLNRKLKKTVECLKSYRGWSRYSIMQSPGAEIGRQPRLKIE